MLANSVDVEKLNTLVEVNSRINSNYSDLDALLVYILESAMRLVKCESSSLLLIQDENTLRFEVALGPKGVEALAIPVSVKGSIAGWIVENNQALIINDVPSDKRFFDGVQNKTGYLSKTMIAVPLRAEGQCIGVIELLNKAGGQLFNESDLNILELLCVQAGIAYQNARSYRRAKNEIQDLKTAILTGFEYHDFIARSTVMTDLLSVIEKIARTNSSVLILGESGVGKELVAERIHLKSEQFSKPFVRVNCAALSPLLLESELFGHVRGAFTDAVSDRSGRFETADGGTIFLDEIGEFPLDLQAKLLRVIQNRAFEKVGSSQTIKVDVRIIAATNQNLEQMVKDGKFRSDLFFRLNVLPIHVPPLRDRTADILPLAEFFLKKFSTETKNNFTAFSDEAIVALNSYVWPGNIRELENSIERACILGTPPIVQVGDLRLNIEKTHYDAFSSSDFEDKTLKSVLFLFKKKYVTDILQQCSWNQTETAKVLGVQRTYVSRLMNELSIR